MCTLGLESGFPNSLSWTLHFRINLYQLHMDIEKDNIFKLFIMKTIQNIEGNRLDVVILILH